MNKVYKNVFNYLILAIIVYLLAGSVASATPTVSLEIEGGYYDNVTETWVTSSSEFTLKLILTAGPNENALYGLNLIIAVPGNESSMNNGTVSVDGGATTISSSAYSWGTPLFDEADVGTSQYPSHDIFPTWFALEEINNGGLVSLPQTLTFDIVVAGFDWVHFDAYGFYDVATGKKTSTTIKTHSDFVPPSHDAEYVAEAMAVPEPSTLYLMALGILALIIYRKETFKKKLQAVKALVSIRKK